MDALKVLANSGALQNLGQKQMNRIILILLTLVAFSSNAQELKNDTIPWENIQIVISLPDLSIRKSQLERYEEGFFKIYSLIFGPKLCRYSKPPYIVVHAGYDADMVMPEPDRIIYDCKLGNVASSIYFTSDGMYFRKDIYRKYSFRVFFFNVSEEDLDLANYILDNLKIVPKTKESPTPLRQ